ncbi:MAG TPA: enoyl-CoA hydratase-related protein [Candidatus Eisenbacteria bacterium]|nr:enoyl-CoA hydratase-related protein [Candidatus Eisenbacteria bacterium]
MSPETRVLSALEGPVARITLARPEVRNAFDDVMIVELSRALEDVGERFASDPGGAPRALVITGEGTAFCAGADANWMRRSVSYTREQNETDARRMAAMLRLLDELPVPTIARVNGACLGGGMGLISCCDVVIAVESADFGFTEARLGIAPAVISSFVLPKTGASAARRYFLTAEIFKAETARAIGLVHETVPVEALDARVEAILGTILGNGPRAVAAAKRLLRENLALRRDDAIENSVRAIAALRASEEGQEGLSAFLEKRRPAWKA